ncbi:MAG: hypothetical protein MUF61_02360 [archaeon]|nr:hypothetical protein [archaeon]
MAETIFMEKTGNLRREKDKLEKKLEVTIKIEGKKVTIEGEELKEYEAMIVLEAIKFGFSVSTALLAANEGMVNAQLSRFQAAPLSSRIIMSG